MTNGNAVLLIGGGGYLGSVLTPMLLEQGYQVTVFDRFYFGRESLDAVASHQNLRIVEGDVRRFDEKLLDGVGAVLYMAALSNDPACELDPGWTEAVNRDAAIAVARSASNKGIERFLFSSSCSVYGAGDDLLTENSALHPISVYARTKLDAERQILALASATFHPVALRKATLFGVSPRMRFDLAVNIMTMHGLTKKRVYVTGGGEQWRPFLHVKDAANAYLRCLTAPREAISGAKFNVVSTNLKICDLARLVATSTGAEVNVVPEDADRRDYRVSSNLFKKTVGFVPEYTVDHGIDTISEAIQAGRFGNLNSTRYYTLKTLQEVLCRPACEGGESVRQTFLPFALPMIGKAEEDEVIDTLRSGWITTGPKTRRFEDMCKEYVGTKHAVAVNSCTAALHIALAAARIGPGDEVITTPISWPATANVIILQGATPVFVDVEPDTLNIDATKIEAAITRRTKAIIPVHMAGQPCDMNSIHSIAAKHKLMVIEDAAHAIGARYEGRRIGSLSDATAFSFYPIKNITTIEGGLLATDNDQLADRARMLSLHGVSRDAWKRYSADGALHWQLLEPGFKYNMTDVQASLGLHQLPRLDEFISIREKYRSVYDEAFADLPAIQPLAQLPGRHSAHHLYIVLIRPEYCSITRDQFMLALKAENIGTGVHFISMHLQPYYRDNWQMRPQDFPVAASVSEKLVSLPLYPKMSNDDLRDVIRAVRKICLAYGKSPDTAVTPRSQVKQEKTHTSVSEAVLRS